MIRELAAQVADLIVEIDVQQHCDPYCLDAMQRECARIADGPTSLGSQLPEPTGLPQSFGLAFFPREPAADNARDHTELAHVLDVLADTHLPDEPAADESGASTTECETDLEDKDTDPSAADDPPETQPNHERADPPFNPLMTQPSVEQTDPQQQQVKVGPPQLLMRDPRLQKASTQPQQCDVKVVLMIDPKQATVREQETVGSSSSWQLPPPPPPPPPPPKQATVGTASPWQLIPPPPPLPPTGNLTSMILPPPPADPKAKPRKQGRRTTVDVDCADANCTNRCESYGCRWCAAHCPGLPRTSSVCTSHFDCPGRCTEPSIWCMNKMPADGSCIEARCANHCMNTACARHFGADKPTRLSENRTRSLRSRKWHGRDW